MAGGFIQMRALYHVAQIKIDIGKFLAAALAAVPKIGLLGISNNAVQTEYIMEIPCTFCNKSGNEGLNATLKGIAYRKNYNLQVTA